MKTTPENQKLLDLIEDARKGKIVLPQFQRNFVWSRDDITALVISILNGHYIGSFLLLNADGENVPFAVRPLQGVDLAPSQINPESMILDGQQRLTSLHYAFAAPDIPLRWTRYPYRFFLDLNKVTANDLDNAVISERESYCRNLLERQYQFEKLIVPMTEIEQWNDWLNAYEQWLVERDKDYYFNQYFKIFKPSWNNLLERIRTYQVPTITLPKIQEDNAESLAEVCTIFEKINSTGVKLSVYDLLTARMYKHKIDLHTLWERAIDTHHLLDHYSEGSSDELGVYILRTIALLRGLDVKSKTLINLSPKGFENDWRKATEFMEKALERMTSIDSDGFGVFDRKWMPYLTMVSPLAAMLAATKSKKLDFRAYQLIRRWYWAAVFRERYAGAVESTMYRDYQDFLQANKNHDFEPNALSEARIGILESQAFSLRTVSRLNSLYRGVICLVALNGAKDFSADDSIQFHTLEDHHIFPFAYLKGLKGPDGKSLTAEKMNCVINRTLIADETNKKISKKSPSQYLKSMFPSGNADAILSTHFINPSAMKAMEADDYEQFTTEREKVLVAEIKRRISG
jgi:hypothetical protein